MTLYTPYCEVFTNTIQHSYVMSDIFVPITIPRWFYRTPWTPFPVCRVEVSIISKRNSAYSNEICPAHQH